MNTYSDYSQQEQTRDTATAQPEGPIARKIERQTAKLPSDLFLWAAGAAVITSLGFEVVGMIRGEGRGFFGGLFKGAPKASAPLAGFIGMWVPSLLLLGVYNKIVKVAGSDRTGSDRIGSERISR
jgi:hypothetical protein